MYALAPAGTELVCSRRVQNCNYQRVRTRAANAYTNSFVGTQMFVQAKNKRCVQHMSQSINEDIVDLSGYTLQLTFQHLKFVGIVSQIR